MTRRHESCGRCRCALSACPGYGAVRRDHVLLRKGVLLGTSGPDLGDYRSQSVATTRHAGTCVWAPVRCAVLCVSVCVCGVGVCAESVRARVRGSQRARALRGPRSRMDTTGIHGFMHTTGIHARAWRLHRRHKRGSHLARRLWRWRAYRTLTPPSARLRARAFRLASTQSRRAAPVLCEIAAGRCAPLSLPAAAPCACSH